MSSCSRLQSNLLLSHLFSGRDWLQLGERQVEMTVLQLGKLNRNVPAGRSLLTMLAAVART